ncbi:MAG: hypothetical protein JXR23_09390 [Pontiellaceae bacterium]|nr:hypothetical protein [Pontiellaceae bacterium]
MLEKLVRKKGILYATVFATAMSTLASVGITATIVYCFHLPNMGATFVIATICPLLIAPFVAYTIFRLYEKTDRSREELEKLNQQLAATLTEVKELSGLLPICSSCKKIRDDKGYWNHLEAYISKHSKANFSHGICPDCAQRLYPDYCDDLEEDLQNAQEPGAKTEE